MKIDNLFKTLEQYRISRRDDVVLMDDYFNFFYIEDAGIDFNSDLVSIVKDSYGGVFWLEKKDEQGNLVKRFKMFIAINDEMATALGYE